MSRIPSGELFPTDEPIAPGDLIGRAEDVSAIASALESGTNLVLAEPRRTGKTSVCDAALDQLKGNGLYTVSVDLWEIADQNELAAALVAKTIANRPKTRRLVHEIREKGRGAASSVQLRALTTLTGEFGDDVEIAFEPGLAARDPQRYLDFALRLPQQVAEKDGVRVAVFLDEFQNIRELESGGRDSEALQKRMRSVFQRSTKVSFLFAGSLEHLMKDIFAPTERPFSQFGGFHDLQPISVGDWKSGISARLTRDGCTVDDEALDRLIELGELHPRVTMLIAQQAHLTCVQDGTRDVDLYRINTGYALARRLDRIKHEQVVDRIRHISSGKTTRQHALLIARRIASGTSPYGAPGLNSEAVRRVLTALHDAGVIEPKDDRGWRIADPLFRHYLSDLDPTSV